MLDATALRDTLIEDLCRGGHIRSQRVAAAFRAVPRELFAPAVDLTDVYADEPILPKRDQSGRTTSTVSAPHIHAMQLEQADVAPGMRVLEIGSGGYFAALLAVMTGPAGEVTSVDIDAEVIDRARGCLDRAGYTHVRTLVGDGDTAVPQHGPYDRIVITVRAWDIPPGWVEQLAPDGRLVAPLRLADMTRTVALDRTGDADRIGGPSLCGGDTRLCSFVPMQGAGAHEDRIAQITDHNPAGTDARIQLRSDTLDADQLADAAAAVAAAVRDHRHHPVTVWTGVEFDHVDDLDLWLDLQLAPAVILTADREITDTGGYTSLTRNGVPALVDGGGFAYRTKRPRGDGTLETGVLAWGADAAELADRYAAAITAWGAYRAAGGRGPRLDVYPPGTPLQVSPGQRLLDKPHTRTVVSWPLPRRTP